MERGSTLIRPSPLESLEWGVVLKVEFNLFSIEHLGQNDVMPSVFESCQTLPDLILFTQEV